MAKALSVIGVFRDQMLLKFSKWQIIYIFRSKFEMTQIKFNTLKNYKVPNELFTA